MTHGTDGLDKAVVLLALHDEKDALEAEPLRVKQILFWLFLALALLLVTIHLRSPLVAIWSLLAALSSVSLVIHGSALLTRINHLGSLIDERERSAGRRWGANGNAPACPSHSKLTHPPCRFWRDESVKRSMNE